MITAVLVDQREPQWVQELTFGGALVVTTMLECGDFRVACDDGNELVIERKIPSDLLSSIADGRLMAQAAAMAAASKWSYLLVTGDLLEHGGRVVSNGHVTGWSYAALQGALLSVQELGVAVTYCAGNSDVESAIERLAGRNRSEQTYIRPRRDAMMATAGEAALLALPGIGFERLSLLMQHTGTAAAALEYLTDPGPNGTIPNLGYQTKSKIRAALGLEAHEQLTITRRQ